MFCRCKNCEQKFNETITHRCVQKQYFSKFWNDWKQTRATLPFIYKWQNINSTLHSNGPIKNKMDSVKAKNNIRTEIFM